MRCSLALGLLAACASCGLAGAQAKSFQTPIEMAGAHQPFEFGAVLSGGNGLTDQRGGFHFLQAGVHAGKVLTGNVGGGPLRGNVEYAMELYPYWQSATPVFPRVSCTGSAAAFTCSQPYNVGGTFHGIEFRPIIVRYNLAHHGRFTPWVQAAGGLLYTTHKYPSYGSTSANFSVNGPNSDTSVFNFTPQGGVGFHYFTSAHRSVDFSANGEHISSASLGDRNPGVNASVQFSLGYTWWK